MSVFCECRVLSRRGLCDDLIIRPEESYRLWRVVVYDLEPLLMRRPWPTGCCRAKNKQTNFFQATPRSTQAYNHRFKLSTNILKHNSRKYAGL